MHIAAFVPILVYGLHHIFNEVALLGWLLLANDLILVFSFHATLKDLDLDIYLKGFVMSMTVTIAVVCYYLGLRGVLFVFPLLTSYFYSFEYKTALLFSVIASAICMLAALNSIEPEMVARISVGVSLTIFFNASFSALLHKQNRSLQVEADQDFLTGISNRRSFNACLQREIAQANKDGRFLALFYIDLDDFKRINDNYGHTVGDEVLKQASQRLVNSVRSTDRMTSMDDEKSDIARYAGDEFALAVTHINSIDQVNKILDRILESLNKLYEIDNLVFKVGSSIGVAISGSDGQSAEELLKNADAAMFVAKSNVNKQYQFFNEDISNQIIVKQSIEKAIEDALEKEEFFLVFMPMYETNSLSICGVEVLLRSTNPILQKYGPDKFIPVAEQSGLIFDIDLWVIESVLKKIEEINQMGTGEKLLFCINISASELGNERIIDDIKKIFEKYTVAPEQVELEVTETSLINIDEKTIDILNQLKSYGFRLSLDDFGTGYTAFNQLASYPVDTLKVDRSFVNMIGNSSDSNSSMVNVVTLLASLYELEIVAEGVETQEQLNYLRAISCHYVQGYFLSKPVEWQHFLELLATNKTLLN